MVQISMKDNIVKRSTLIPIFVCSGDVATLLLYNEHTPLCILIRHKGRGYPKDSQTFVALFSVFLVFFCDFQWFRLSASPLAMIISRLRRLRIGLINRLPPREGQLHRVENLSRGAKTQLHHVESISRVREESATPCRKHFAAITPVNSCAFAVFSAC